MDAQQCLWLPDGSLKDIGHSSEGRCFGRWFRACLRLSRSRSSFGALWSGESRYQSHQNQRLLKPCAWVVSCARSLFDENKLQRNSRPGKALLESTGRLFDHRSAYGRRKKRNLQACRIGIPFCKMDSGSSGVFNQKRFKKLWRRD